MDLLLRLRALAMACSKPEIRRALRSSADSLDKAIRRFADEPTTHNLTLLNGYWAAAERVAMLVPPEGTPAAPLTDAVGVFEPQRKAA